MGKVNNALRMLAILRSRRKVTRRELSEELEVGIREITRYKEALDYSGVTITEVKGRYGGYILENKDYLLNLELSNLEELSLIKAKEYLKDQGLHFYTDLSSAIEKIKASKPRTSSAIYEEIYSKGIKIRANHEEESNKWLTINDGIAYTNSNGESSERIIHPYGLYTYYGSNYFVGFCEDKQDIRNFKLVRIKNIDLLNEKFDKKDFSLKEYLGQTIGVFKDNLYNVKLKISYPYAQGFKEYCWVDNEEIEDHINEGFIIYKAAVEGKTQLIPWIMGMGTACEVLEPEDLRAEVIAAFEEVLNKYKQGSKF